MTRPATLTRQQIVDDIAGMVDVASEEISDDTDVVDLGLDSVRLMSLVERWRATGAPHADLITLASDPVVGSWVRELAPSDHRR